MGNSRRHNRLNCDTVLFHSVCFSHFIAVVSICRGRILIHFIKSGAHKMWCALFTYSSLVSLICFSVCVDFFSRTGMGASWCLFSCLKKKTYCRACCWSPHHFALHYLYAPHTISIIVHQTNVFLQNIRKNQKKKRRGEVILSFFSHFFACGLYVCFYERAIQTVK